MTQKYTVRDGLLYYKQRLYITNDTGITAKILSLLHDGPIGDHSVYDKTMHKMRMEFFWLGMKSDLKKYIKECEICQRVKSKNTLPGGLLQPIFLPSKPWINITIDFIEGLPFSKGYNVLWVVVGRFIKYAHFVSLTHPYMTLTLA